MHTTDGGPAFPQHDLSGYGIGPSEGDDGLYHLSGMSRRDWFAGQALNGLIASGTFSNAGGGFEDFIATHAVNIADATLAALSLAKGEGK